MTVPALAEALDNAVEFLRGFIIFQHEEQGDAAALWVAVTHCYDAFDVAPYLLVTSPERGSGKTVLLDCLEVTVREPLMGGSISAAVVARITDDRHPTWLIDEIDVVYRDKTESGEALRGVLNAGHRRGTPYLRMGGPKHNILQEFDTFGPKALAGIDKTGRQIPDTIRDRSVPIRLQRATPSAERRRFRYRLAMEEAKPLRDAFEQRTQGFSFDYLTEIPDDLAGRAADVWEPLLAVADYAGQNWPKRARKAAESLGAPDSDTDSLGVRLLADVRDIWSNGAQTMFTTEMLGRLKSLDEAPWETLGENGLDARSLASLLRPYGVVSGTVRSGSDTAKGYSRDRLTHVWEAYLGPANQHQLNLLPNEPDVF